LTRDRKAPPKRAERIGQDRHRGGRRDRRGDRAGHRALRLLDVVARPLHLGDDQPCAHLQLLTERGQLHAARGTHDERHAERDFQLLDRLRQRCRRHVQAPRGRADAPFVRNGDECFELMVFHGDTRESGKPAPRDAGRLGVFPGGNRW
jgi:hypothetical protein